MERKIIDRKSQGEFVSNFLRQIKFKRSDFKTINSLGGFTSLIDLGNFAVSFNNDGVGTKTIIAAETNKYNTIGIDCVAMNVNDAITVGAEPIAMLDYLSLKEMDNEIARQLGIGFNVGAQIANLNIVGGETAIVPDLVKNIDISATSLGLIQKDQIITGEKISDGDLIFALKSSGLHSNGFTTVRKIIKDNEIDYEDQFPGDSKRVADVLLEPTRIYVREVLDAMSIVPIKGMANITGGGIKNIARMKDMKYVIDNPFDVDNVFLRLMDMGNLSFSEMFEIFNMGMGYIVVIDPESKTDFLNIVRNRVPVKEVGHVENGSGITIPEYSVEMHGYY
ncbi:phosphoribosylformylglycinamidine cyclo-ligase [Ferroplasma acidiphilum]|uniref:phosphoribosylformylglycinamidine cyclo-ligase n=1 Tax=Ferroplasma acidiphilum TaxID=74969 RepID=A0A7K4FPR4_9ARCH|nr:phosphoribosylformylglycinamidine cyclo-ligase [Ferroplasma acidiphilum]MCL4349495.1 phosphoribosylformylglycinamidine cyclo-ligase [Candidatus Thermoplasmatota archaeon]NOL60298.1 phosphoribosylformylglycinamidine cyclo-ligase [Ferroplasma acidiphilum]WMT52828.1 MAG: phosphoribosylformylglycinamidine cyclo-ligase [Ferroplasma acidiphilum]